MSDTELARIKALEAARKYSCVICTTPIDKLYSVWDQEMPIVSHVAFCSVCLAVLKTLAIRHQHKLCSYDGCHLERAFNSDRCLDHKRV
jgi:hypothetical protein